MSGGKAVSNDGSGTLTHVTDNSSEDLECAEIVVKFEAKYRSRASKSKRKSTAVKSSRKYKTKVLRPESFLKSDRRKSLAANVIRLAHIYKKVSKLLPNMLSC